MDSRSSSDIDLVQRLLFEPVPTLQEMTSFEIVFRLHSSITCLCETESSSNDYSVYRQVSSELQKKISHLRLPTPIEKIIETRADSIYAEIDRWVNEGDNYSDIMPIDIDSSKMTRYCIWKQNGKIDDKKTAQNIIRLSCELTIEQKFEIMCKYCLKNEIDLVPLDALSSSFLDSANTYRLGVLYYWIQYKKNELHNITIGDFGSLDKFMLTNYQVWDAWAAAEYFWDRLDAEDQISVAQELIIEDGPILNHQKRIWSKMSQGQRSAILSAIPVKIILNFWRELLEFELAHAVWMQIKEFITNEQFAELLRMLSIHTIHPEDAEIDLLIDVWNSAASRLKDYVLEYKRNEIMRLYCIPNHLGLNNMKLLLAMLKYTSVQYRKDFITEFGSELTLRCDDSVVKDVLDLCAA